MQKLTGSKRSQAAYADEGGRPGKEAEDLKVEASVADVFKESQKIARLEKIYHLVDSDSVASKTLADYQAALGSIVSTSRLIEFMINLLGVDNPPLMINALHAHKAPSMKDIMVAASKISTGLETWIALKQVADPAEIEFATPLHFDIWMVENKEYISQIEGLGCRKGFYLDIETSFPLSYRCIPIEQMYISSTSSVRWSPDQLVCFPRGRLMNYLHLGGTQTIGPAALVLSMDLKKGETGHVTLKSLEELGITNRVSDGKNPLRFFPEHWNFPNFTKLTFTECTCLYRFDIRVNFPSIIELIYDCSTSKNGELHSIMGVRIKGEVIPKLKKLTILGASLMTGLPLMRFTHLRELRVEHCRFLKLYDIEVFKRVNGNILHPLIESPFALVL